MLTHGNLLANLDQMQEVPALAQAQQDVVLLALPMFHIYGLNVGLNLTLREGATGLLYFVRRYCAKILYEVEFHAVDDVTTMRRRYDSRPGGRG